MSEQSRLAPHGGASPEREGGLMGHGGRFDSPDERDAWEAKVAQRAEAEERRADEFLDEEQHDYVAPPKRERFVMTPNSGVEAKTWSIPSKRQVAGQHYADLPIQPSEFIHRNALGWCEGNAVKYISRHKRKGGREDIQKAIHYLELLLEWEYGND